MALNIKLPVIVTTNNDSGEEIEDLIYHIKDLTGVKLKKKSLDKGYGSSQCDYILFQKKDRKYTELLEKFISE